MLCPNCQKELIIVERERVELDYCLFCNGFWFDNLEWELLSKRLSLRDGKSLGDLYSIPKAYVKEEIKKCPVCQKPMDKFLFYDIVLDRCPDKHGIWFDNKEISAVFNSQTSQKGAVVEFLGETFYKK